MEGQSVTIEGFQLVLAVANACIFPPLVAAARMLWRMERRLTRVEYAVGVRDLKVTRPDQLQ
jgi:hypothetical protein